MQTLVFALLIGVPQFSEEPGFLVVVSANSEMEHIRRYQLKQIFLGKIDRVQGSRITPIQFKPGHPTRNAFEASLFGEGFKLQDYWLDQKIKRELRPPLEVDNWALLLAFIERNPGFLGYVSSEHLQKLQDFGVKVLKVLP